MLDTGIWIGEARRLGTVWLSSIEHPASSESGPALMPCRTRCYVWTPPTGHRHPFSRKPRIARQIMFELRWGAHSVYKSVSEKCFRVVPVDGASDGSYQ